MNDVLAAEGQAGAFATPRQGLDAARQALARDDLATARAIWAAIRGRFPDAAAAYGEEALALVQMGRFAEAEALQAAGIERFPAGPGLWNDHAWSAYFRADYAAAAERWQAMRTRFPDDPAGHVHGAMALRRAGRADEADALREAALPRFGEIALLWIEHAEAAFERGEFAEALRRWEDALARFPLDRECYLLGSRMLAQAGRMERANLSEDGRLRIAVRRCLGQTLDGETQMSSLEFLDALKSADLAPPVREAVERLAGEEATNGDYYQAIQVLCGARLGAAARQVLDVLAVRLGRTSDLRFQLMVAKVEDAEGFTPRALSLLEQARREHPTNIHAYLLQSEMLARLGDYAAALDVLASTPLDEAPPVNADTVFRGLRLSVYLAAAGDKPVFADPPPAAPVESAAVVMMIRDEADIIGQNLRHHYRMGVRKFTILLNCCADATAAIVEQFRAEHPDAILCTVVDPAEGYYQASKTQAAVGFARAYFAAIRRPVTWCFVLDADEFVSIDGQLGLAGLIARAEQAGHDFITLHLCDATSASGEDYAAGQDIYGFFDAIAGCAVPVVTKNAFRLEIEPEIGMGNHWLAYPGMGIKRAFIAAQAGARLVHLPYRSAAQMKTKIVNGATAYEATTLDRTLGAHWRRFYQQYLDEGEAMLTEQMRVFREKTLRQAKTQAPFFF
jgi:tetratricopeptide (TPR) repeat protein